MVTGPHVEEGGAAAAAGLGGMVSSGGSGGRHSLSIGRRDGRSMRVLKRDDESGRLIEHHKSMLTLIFADRGIRQPVPSNPTPRSPNLYYIILFVYLSAFLSLCN